MGPLNVVTAVASAIGSFFNYITGRSTAAQAADIKAAHAAKEEQAAQDKANDAIQKGNIDEIRNDISE